MNDEDLGKDESQLYKEGKIGIIEYLEIKKRNIDFNQIYLIDWSISESEQMRRIKAGEQQSAKQMFDEMGIKIEGRE